ncbi:MAG: hypothetical protein ACLT0R_17545 [Paraclostridium sordellii]|uniref:hypothetical protein n=1 Tax=Paraclostridium sordellii TaxID=1505 RepID=UPI00189A34B2|nr:hypothetical protein [Paeniclostridium sordellii]
MSKKDQYKQIDEILEEVKKVDIVKYAELLIANRQAKASEEIAYRLLEIEKTIDSGITIYG